ncbi:carboxymuconolactone decarboxylase family protein [Phenylobacterium terrae]|uniref:Carboxymuconolactone decarboxylase family protein n=1 Tax=Phenylobacterium terrae TaxID=2665495 RepID=A0ABW4N615_9CAUL
MARVRYLDRDEIAPEVQALLGHRPPLNLYRALPHSPPSAVGFLTLGSALRRESELSPKLRELVTLRVGVISKAAYEVTQHRRVARSVGMTAEEIAAATREGPEDCLTEFERLTLRFTEAVVHEVKAPELLYRAVAAELSERQMVELLMLIGFYMLVCRFLENAEVDLEDPPIPG